MSANETDAYAVEDGTHFNRIAAQLNAGRPYPLVRDDLMTDYGLSRLQAGKLVEDVTRGVRKAKLLRGSGITTGLIGLGMLLFIGRGLLPWFLFVSGALQVLAAVRTLKAFKNAREEPAQA